jgi:hypothetical protein
LIWGAGVKPLRGALPHTCLSQMIMQTPVRFNFKLGMKS